MKVEEITETNIEKYGEFLDAEEADNIGRCYFRSFGLSDDEGSGLGALIFQFRYLEDDGKKTLSLLKSVLYSDVCADRIFELYGSSVSKEKVSQSEFELASEKYASKKDDLIKHGFSVKDKESSEIRVTVGELKKLSVMKLGKKIPDYVHDLSDMDERTFKRGILNCIFHVNREVPEDLNRLDPEWFERDVSSCSESDGRVEGFLLVRRSRTGRLRLIMLCDVGAEPDQELFNMMRFSIIKAGELYPDETEVIIPRKDSMARKLTDFIFPGKKGGEVLFGTRREG